MSLAFDAFTGTAGRTTVASVTISHTVTGTDPVIFVSLLRGNINAISGITYAGAALTLLDAEKVNHSTAFISSVWYKLGCATGTNNVVITFTGATDNMPLVISYNGASPSGFPDAYNNFTLTTGNSPKTETLTTIADNAWMLWFGIDEFNTTEAAGSGTTLRGVNSGYGGVFFADSGGAFTPAGSHSLNIVPGNAADWMNDFVWSLAPATAGGGDLAAFVGEPITGSSPISL